MRFLRIGANFKSAMASKFLRGRVSSRVKFVIFAKYKLIRKDGRLMSSLCVF